MPSESSKSTSPNSEAAPSPARPIPQRQQRELSLILLLCFFAIVFVAIKFGPSMLRGLSDVVSVLVLAAFALFVTLILSGVLGAAGVLRTKTQQLGGAVVVWCVVFSGLVKARENFNSDWALRLVINGLPEQAPAKVSVGECSAQAVGPLAHVNVTIHPNCESADVLNLNIEVSGYAAFQQKLPKSAAVNQETEIQYVGHNNRLILAGSVMSHGQPAIGASVILVGCPGAQQGQVGQNGGFTIDAPLSCTQTEPYTLVATRDKERGSKTTEKLSGIVVNVSAGTVIADVRRDAPGAYSVSLTQSAGSGHTFWIGESLLLTPDGVSGELFVHSEPPAADSSVEPHSATTEQAEAFFRDWKDISDETLQRARDALDELRAPRALLCERARQRTGSAKPDMATLARNGKEGCGSLVTEVGVIQKSLKLCPNDASLGSALADNSKNMRRLGCP